MSPLVSASSTQNNVTEASNVQSTPKIKNTFHSLLASDIAVQLGKTTEDRFTAEDAAKITSLVIKPGVTTFKGVNQLVNLEQLFYAGGSVKSIDLSANKKIKAPCIGPRSDDKA